MASLGARVHGEALAAGADALKVAVDSEDRTALRLAVKVASWTAGVSLSR